MHHRSFVFVPWAVIFSVFFSVFSFAQKTSIPFSTERWGKAQRVKEMLAYWHYWDRVGTDTNVEAARQRGLKQFLTMPRPNAFKQTPQSTPAWEQVATSQGKTSAAVSGRATDIAWDPRDEFNTLYLATSGGGLWKTTNAASSEPVKWVPISNSFGTYAIGAVAVHPDSNDIVYAATGDLHDGDGDGLYKSTDAGLNWERIATSVAISTRSNQLIINPHKPKTIYHSGINALRVSNDGGYTWRKIKSLGNERSIPHMILDPTDTNRLYAAGGGMIIRSTDAGATWSTDRAANIASKGRITLGFSPADSSKVYASISKGDGVSIGVGLSTDFGETWAIKDYESYMGEQGWYDNACVAHPTKPNIVLVGGLDIWRSTTSGTLLGKRTNWTANNGATNFTHADIHVLKYSPNGKLYALTDGGVFVSGSDGSSWISLNNDLGTLLFVGADVAPDLSYMIGGTQDNGVNRAAAGETTFDQTAGGDGGRTFVDQQNGTTVYSTHFGPDLFKSTTRGTGNWAYGLLQGTPLEAEQTPFYMNYDVCESDAAYVALCGNRNVYYSEDGVASIAMITPTAIMPSSVHIATADPYYLYVSAGGYVHTTPDAGETWVKSTTRIGSSIAGFVTDPNDKMKAWTVTSGYGGKEFWLTEDGGKTWTSPATNLPDLNAKTIARSPEGDLFIGHEFGVLRSVDNGVTWEPLRDGMPLADVRKLRVRNGYLFAATYGRSIYKINSAELPRPTKSVSSVEDPNFRIASISPNPVTSGVEMQYKTSVDSKVMVVLYDELGREVRILANEFNYAGDHTLRTNLGDLPTGAYTVVLTSGGKAITERLVITR